MVMQKYQPEFIDDNTIRSILKSCIPFFEEKAGRFWLDNISSSRLKVLIATGLNSIDEAENLNRPIELRKAVLQRREEARKLNDEIIQYNNEIFKKLEEENLTPEQAHNLKLQLMHYVDEGPIDPTTLYYEIDLFTAWQKALESDFKTDQKQKSPGSFNLPPTSDTAQIDNSKLLIPISIMKLANAELIQETSEGSQVFINQKESLEALKGAIKARKLEFPTNKDIHTFIFKNENGVITPYDDSTIRRAFSKRVRTCRSV